MDDAEQDPTRGFIMYRIGWAYLSLAQQSAALLEKHVGLTNRQWWILAEMVASNPETASEIARRTGVDKALVSRNLQALSDKGLVDWSVKPGDRRAKVLTLTDAGRERHRRAREIMETRNSFVLRDIDEADVERAVDVLHRLISASEETDLAAMK